MISLLLQYLFYISLFLLTYVYFGFHAFTMSILVFVLLKNNKFSSFIFIFILLLRDQNDHLLVSYRLKRIKVENIDQKSKNRKSKTKIVFKLSIFNWNNYQWARFGFILLNWISSVNLAINFITINSVYLICNLNVTYFIRIII